MTATSPRHSACVETVLRILGEVKRGASDTFTHCVDRSFTSVMRNMQYQMCSVHRARPVRAGERQERSTHDCVTTKGGGVTFSSPPGGGGDIVGNDEVRVGREIFFSSFVSVAVDIVAGARWTR